MAIRFKEQLGAEIRRRRVELGLSQKDLATAAHVAEAQTISRWERGLTAPSDLDAAAAALQTTIPELMAGIQLPTRMAHKLNLEAEPEPELSLMERVAAMDAKLDQLLALLSGEPESPPEEPAAAVAETVAQLAGTAGSPPRKARGAQRSSQAAAPRNSA